MVISFIHSFTAAEIESGPRTGRNLTIGKSELNSVRIDPEKPTSSQSAQLTPANNKPWNRSGKNMHLTELTRLPSAAYEDTAVQAQPCGELSTLHPVKGKSPSLIS